MLAVIGLYAVIAHAVSQRTREIGLRMAMGASRSDIARLVFAQGISAAGARRGDWAAPCIGRDALAPRGVGWCIAQRSVDLCRDCAGADDRGCVRLCGASGAQ